MYENALTLYTENDIYVCKCEWQSLVYVCVSVFISIEMVFCANSFFSLLGMRFVSSNLFIKIEYCLDG